MGYLGATLTQVFTRARRADVSLRDVTIARDEKKGLLSAGNVTHRKRAEDFGNLKKVSRVETRQRTRRLTFACSRRPWAGVARDWGADEKARIERLCFSLLMSKNLLTQRNKKKKFRT